LNAAAVAKAKNIMKHRFPTMIEYYLEDTQSYIDQIRRGLDEGSYAQLVVPSHTIKSSSRQMGAYAVAELGQKIEAMARAEEVSFETLSELTNKLQEQFDLSRIDFNHLLSEAG
ncbi:MAG TPA: Hpt domain-containing protein, partial [Marinagarivorans sp.]